MLLFNKPASGLSDILVTFKVGKLWQTLKSPLSVTTKPLRNRSSFDEILKMIEDENVELSINK